MLGCRLAGSSLTTIHFSDFQFTSLQNVYSRTGKLHVACHFQGTSTSSLSVELVQNQEVKVLMVAGGTGGHVYPAIAVADEIRKLNPRARVQFAGTKDRLEWSAVPQAGYEISAIPAVPIERPLWSIQNLLLPFKLLHALFFCLKVIGKIRPHVVVGTGGYVSGPLCLAAAISGYPVVIQEQNASAGITNFLLGKIARSIFVAFWAATAYFPRDRCMLYGNPTRIELRQYVSAAVARRTFFPLDDQGKSFTEVQTGKLKKKQVVLILGGSLGALAINETVAAMAVKMLEENPERYIIWQTGRQYYDRMLHRTGHSHNRLAIYPFVNAMHMAYAAADLVVARAGAITCSELLITGKPAILIPSKNVADDHQTKNANAMLESGCARVLSEDVLTPSELASMIDDLLSDGAALTDMMEKALKAASPDAAKLIAQHILVLASKQAYSGDVISP